METQFYFCTRKIIGNIWHVAQNVCFLKEAKMTVQPPDHFVTWYMTWEKLNKNWVYDEKSKHKLYGFLCTMHTVKQTEICKNECWAPWSKCNVIIWPQEKNKGKSNYKTNVWRKREEPERDLISSSEKKQMRSLNNKCMRWCVNVVETRMVCKEGKIWQNDGINQI